MIGVDAETVRVFLHVLAATVWVGGQVTLAALVPALRPAGSDVTRAAARAFNRIAWPAFGVLLVTGVWNVLAADDTSSAFDATLGVKYVLVGLSGLTAFLHARATDRRQLAIFGALTGLTALGALFVGVMLGTA